MPKPASEMLDKLTEERETVREREKDKGYERECGAP